jgi:tRNA A58 N-methylase Trm61
MIEEACVAIDEVSEKDRRAREAKYARRNKMRYIDQLLNELEMLNLAEQRQMPQALSVAVDQLRVDSDVEAILDMPKPDSVIEAMDVLYEIQDSLMFNQIDDE